MKLVIYAIKAVFMSLVGCHYKWILTSSHLAEAQRYWCPVCLWSAFPSGPDWACETSLALQFLDDWQQSVLPHRTSTPIIDVLVEAEGISAGIGQHLVNDLLYLLAIHPDMPANELCSDEVAFLELCEFFPKFMSLWFSNEFIKHCGGRANSVNPFAFNKTSNMNFLQQYVHVFHSPTVFCHNQLFNWYLSKVSLTQTMSLGFHIHIHHHRNGVQHYHVFQAQVPAHWHQNDGDINFDNICTAGYQTTVGVASFHEVLYNKSTIILGPVNSNGVHLLAKLTGWLDHLATYIQMEDDIEGLKLLTNVAGLPQHPDYVDPELALTKCLCNGRPAKVHPHYSASTEFHN
ncbi:hypothetical protein C8J57DRAFT_1253656 [Mycena rebaudengoi]|nr:hypothetical protein C8J57DRAFT_1253656 [Mycena rebaudengoi]